MTKWVTELINRKKKKYEYATTNANESNAITNTIKNAITDASKA